MSVQHETIEGPGGQLVVHGLGEGPAIVMLPSLGRGASDFDELATRLSSNGYLALTPEPRGIGGSVGVNDDLSMADLAGDVAAVVKAFDCGPATIVGHAFGNRVARMTATEHPVVVDAVVLLACGGLISPAPRHAQALRDVFDTTKSAEAHLEAVATAFFSPGNDASVWADGWHPEVARAQRRATTSLPSEYWWGAGSADVLVVQPADDTIALRENAQAIAAELGDRATVVIVDDAGHALLPEQPAAVAATILRWIERR